MGGVNLSRYDFLGTGFNCSFNATGYVFIEIRALFGVDTDSFREYRKLIPVSSLKDAQSNKIPIYMRINNDNYYTGWYTISLKKLEGFYHIELVGSMAMIQSVAVYGIK